MRERLRRVFGVDHGLLLRLPGRRRSLEATRSFCRLSATVVNCELVRYIDGPPAEPPILHHLLKGMHMKSSARPKPLVNYLFAAAVILLAGTAPSICNAQTTIAVVPGPNVSVLKGGFVNLAPLIQNTGSTALAPADYTFVASGGNGISYTGMPSQPIPSSGSANFSTFASTTPGPAGTPIGLALISFTVPASAAVTNSPQSGSLQLNVGGTTADNTNLPGAYGPALTAVVGPSGSYSGLESQVVAVNPGTGSSAGNTDARILTGGNSSATSRTVAMGWRSRFRPRRKALPTWSAMW